MLGTPSFTANKRPSPYLSASRDRTVFEMSRDHTFEVHTLELGPYDTLNDLHRELSNHTSTFANIVFERENGGSPRTC